MFQRTRPAGDPLGVAAGGRPGRLLGDRVLLAGDLKGNQGNQNYEVPAEVSLDDYLTVAIWCRRFNYTFNAAEIHTPPA